MPSDRAERLFQRWQDCFRALSLDPPAAAYPALVERYSERQRAYHNLQHIADCFDRLDELAGAGPTAAIGLALFFHDVIYDPYAKDNEARSADWAEDVLSGAGATRETRETVTALILATRHDQAPVGHEAQIIVDIDLSILGADPARFDAYERQIREEYAGVPEPAFRLGRAAVLRKFLDRPSIFSTANFRERYESRARENLAKSLKGQ
jgi:predicted metal-dependent HD superfamily phosphohydrolase